MNNEGNTEAKKAKNFFGWLLWWQIDKDELQKQVDNYASLKITQSARGISTLFMCFSCLITFLLLIFGWISVDPYFAIIEALVFLFLAYFTYRGKRWAMVFSMILWTLEKGVSLFSGLASDYSPIMSVIWWTTYMHAFYLAFRVENERRKLTPVLKDIPNSTFCYKCGEVLETGSKFCVKCGTKVVYPPIKK